MSPVKRRRKNSPQDEDVHKPEESEEGEVDESEEGEVDESGEEEVDTVQDDPKEKGFLQAKALKKRYIVLQVVKNIEESEPEVAFMPFNIDKTGEQNENNEFPRLFDRMLKNTPSLQHAQVLPRSLPSSNKFDYLLMNASENGDEGFDHSYEGSDGEERDLEDLKEDITRMFEDVEKNGYATARAMFVKEKKTFVQDRWVTVHITPQ